MDRTATLIIVDDEAIIREGLRDMVDWRGLGFRVVGCFEDGAEAIDFLANNRVDVILTDIIMAEATGIDIARTVSEKYPGTRVVILSGYRNFDFAKQAMKYHACEYLLKPVDFDELERIFLTLKQEMSGTGSPEDSDPNLQAVRRALFIDIALDRITTTEELLHRSGALADEIDPENGPCARIVFHISKASATSNERSLRTGVVTAISGRCQGCRFEATVDRNNDTVVMVTAREPGDYEAFVGHLEADLDACRASIDRAFQVEIGISVERSAKSLVSFIPAPVPEKRPVDSHAASDSAVPEDPVLAKITGYLEANYARDISLTDIAARAYLSPVYFSKYFKDHSGVTFTDYLADLRVRKAISLFREKKHRIRDVGRMVGYPNPRYFARVFRKKTGYSPREYCTNILAMEQPPEHRYE